MAVKREFGSERQPSEAKDWPAALQDPANAKNSEPEDIDSLVSSFLAELTDLSSEISRDVAPETGFKPQPVAQDARMPAGLRSQEAIQSQSEPDLESLNEELEKALTELESLRPGAIPLKKDSAPQARLKPAEPSTKAKIETPAEPAEIPSIHTEEKARTKPEIFRNSAYASNPVPRRHLGIWIAAGVILVAVLAVLAFYLQMFDNIPSPVRKTASNSEVSPSQPAPERTQIAPAVPEKSSGNKSSGASSGPVEPIRSPIREQTKLNPVAKSATRNEATGNSKPTGSSVAGSEIRRPAQPNGNGSSPEKINTNEAPARPAPAQEAVAVPSPQKPELAAAPAENAAGGNDSTAPVAASVREIPPAAPKPAPSVNTEPVNTPVQPKTGTLVPPVILARFQAEYPALARTQRIDGTVDVEVDVNEKGEAVRVKAVSGPILLHAAAEIAVMKSKFRPASLDGVYTAGKTRISVSFKLQ